MIAQERGDSYQTDRVKAKRVDDELNEAIPENCSCRVDMPQAHGNHAGEKQPEHDRGKKSRYCFNLPRSFRQHWARQYGTLIGVTIRILSKLSQISRLLRMALESDALFRKLDTNAPQRKEFAARIHRCSRPCRRRCEPLLLVLGCGSCVS